MNLKETAKKLATKKLAMTVVGTVAIAATGVALPEPVIAGLVDFLFSVFG